MLIDTTIGPLESARAAARDAEDAGFGGVVDRVSFLVSQPPAAMLDAIRAVAGQRANRED